MGPFWDSLERVATAWLDWMVAMCSYRPSSSPCPRPPDSTMPVKSTFLLPIRICATGTQSRFSEDRARYGTEGPAQVR